MPEAGGATLITWLDAWMQAQNVPLWGVADLSGFADAGSVNDWAVDAMRWAVGQKLIAGITLEQSVYLQPRGNATRAQAATVLTRYYAQ